jgi:hypothetical protein
MAQRWLQSVRTHSLAAGRGFARACQALSSFVNKRLLPIDGAVEIRGQPPSRMTDRISQQTAAGLAAAFTCSLTPDLIRTSMRGGCAIAAELGIDLD